MCLAVGGEYSIEGIKVWFSVSMQSFYEVPAECDVASRVQSVVFESCRRVVAPLLTGRSKKRNGYYLEDR